MTAHAKDNSDVTLCQEWIFDFHLFALSVCRATIYMAVSAANINHSYKHLWQVTQIKNKSRKCSNP